MNEAIEKELISLRIEVEILKIMYKALWSDYLNTLKILEIRTKILDDLIKNLGGAKEWNMKK